MKHEGKTSQRPGVFPVTFDPKFVEERISAKAIRETAKEIWDRLGKDGRSSLSSESYMTLLFLTEVTE